MHQLPHSVNGDIFLMRLISKTAQGKLFEEIETFLNKNGRNAMGYHETLAHTLEAFLGPEEQDALKEELRKVKHSQRQDIPA